MDKIEKALQKLSQREREIIKKILIKIKERNLSGLDLKKLKGRDDIYRIRKGKIRIIFYRKDLEIKVLSIERRSQTTYNSF